MNKYLNIKQQSKKQIKQSKNIYIKNILKYSISKTIKASKRDKQYQMINK